VTPITYFNDVWSRCDGLTNLHNHVAQHAANPAHQAEILRAEWVARVSALDLYVHELVAQRMVEIFENTRAATQAYGQFEIRNDTLIRIRRAANPQEARAAFDLDVREQLSRTTYQFPDEIAEGIRLFSEAELWNDLAGHIYGGTPQQRTGNGRYLRRELTLIVRRRNTIVHEGDLEVAVPRVPLPIAPPDLAAVRTRIGDIVRAMEVVLV